jgi:orotate phosphoribosyltransferase
VAKARSVNGSFVPFGRSTVGRVDRTDLARRIHDAAHLTGTFTLRSGVVSHEYFDKYRFESDPQLLADIATACGGLVPDGISALAGLELGGVPLATMISQVTRLPAVFVRKEAKTYGTCRLAEGAEISGERLCIVEDVVTSGGAVLDAAVELRARGAVLGPVICVIDRESGGREKLAADDLELVALYSMSELNEAAAGA